jgi:hypothetical protein
VNTPQPRISNKENRMRTVMAATANVARFHTAITTCQERGAREANLVVVTGEPGLGKSLCVDQWATQTGGIYLRANANWTCHWFLSDLVKVLGLAPKRTNEDLFLQALEAMLRRPYGAIGGLIIDEAEHALHHYHVLEGIRDLSDRLDFPVVLVGMGPIKSEVARYPQIASRVSAVVQFDPATLEDVKSILATVCEVEVAPDLAKELLQATAGRYRLILHNIPMIECAGEGLGRPVTVADLAGQAFVTDWQAARLRRGA